MAILFHLILVLFWAKFFFFADGERAELFERKKFEHKPKVPTTNVKKRSLLSEQLERCPNLPQNPYIEYSKCDGNVSSTECSLHHV